MFADALREVRYHRGRVVATIIAIAISVGFMAAVSTFIGTQQHALGTQAALPASKADVVVTINGYASDKPPTVADITKAVSGASGVDTSDKVISDSAAFSKGDRSLDTTVYGLVTPTFRWSSLTSGAWPTSARQIALSQSAADRLGVQVGATIDTTTDSGTTHYTVVGITDDPKSLFMETAYLASSDPLLASATSGSSEITTGQWLVRVKQGVSPDQVRDEIASALAGWNDTSLPADQQPVIVRTGPQEQQASLNQLTGDFNVIKYMLLGFAAIAALVGIIIIATTFTILLAQRRRQIGLMRAVGASGEQVRRRLLAEAVIIGAVGSLAGIVLGVIVAAGGTWYTHAIDFGLRLPWTSLVVEWVVGVVMTIIAAVVPAHRATRVAPLEALRPVATLEQKRASLVRAIFCGVVAVGGIVLVVESQVGHHNQIVYAVGGAACLSIAVLFGAPLFVPWIIRGFGWVISRFGATPRLAASNAVRNPSRSAATATALMLAVGLIVTLQVGTASVRSTYTDWLTKHYPVDVSVSTFFMGETPTSGTDPAWLPGNLVGDLSSVRNVTQRITLEGRTLSDSEISTGGAIALVWTPDMQQFAGAPADPGASTVLLQQAGDSTPKTVTLTLDGKRHEFKVKTTYALDSGQVMFSSQDASLLGQVKPAAVWMKVADRSNMGPTMTDLQRIIASSMHGSGGELVPINVSGGALLAYLIDQVLNALLMAVTALLGVAVVIALIGVGNTLGLSVIERRRESALLRAMGMQQRSLRVMLLWEAVLLALSGVIVGILAGAFFGWLGVSALLKQAGATTLTMHFSVNWWQTLAMILIAFVAAALASILPGRRAAKASPVAALADE